MSITISTDSYSNVYNLAEQLECSVPTKLAFLPRNFETANSKTELLQEDCVRTLRKRLRSAGIDETPFEGLDKSFNPIAERSYGESVALFITASLLVQNPTMVELAMNVVGNYLSDRFKTCDKNSKSLVKVELVVEKKPKAEYKRIRIEAPAHSLEGIASVLKEALRNESENS